MKSLLSCGRLSALLGCLLCTGTCFAQGVSVSGMAIAQGVPNSAAAASVVWLTPMDASVPVAPMHAVLAQKNKAFEPHLLVVTRGSSVEFPNHDPWFHNVFSLFDGKRFDLGLYEAGSSRTVHFDRAGVSFIFCNIHPQMSAVVVVLDTPYYATTNKAGEYTIASVPPGRYTLHVWNESAQPAALQALSREVQVGDSPRTFAAIHVPITKSLAMAHKNKYGQDYEPPSPNSPVYVQP